MAEPDDPKDDEAVAYLEGIIEEASQRVAAVHRRRLVRQAMLRTTIIALAVSFMTVFYADVLRRHDARRNARYNCVLLGHLSDNLGAFIRTDAALRQAETGASSAVKIKPTGPLGALLKDPQTLRIQARVRELDQRTTDYWLHLLGNIRSAATVNCKTAIA